ncbi:hypothetical protein ACP281_002672, partial [Enterococcus faecalis]
LFYRRDFLFSIYTKYFTLSYPFYDRIYDYKNFDTKYESANQNKQYAEGYKDKKGRLIINTFHPGAIKKEEPLYDSIMEIVERFKSEGLFAK